MFLILAILLFSVFTINVMMGSLGNASFLGDVGEMLLLFAASVAFVAAILRYEAAGRKDNYQNIHGRK